MCTVTIIPLGNAAVGGSSFRLVCNRDESRSRAAALPPMEVLRGQRRAVYPVDAHAGGTWVGVNDAGLAMALLNLNEPDIPRRAYPTSRGDIIPGLLSCTNVQEAVHAARSLMPGRFAPFRLVICDGGSLACIVGRPNGHTASTSNFPRRPTMFTSSGLGDHIVREARRELFRESLSGAAHAARWPLEQDAFHAHTWTDRPELSVHMHRSDARTVSRTIVTVGTLEANLQYTPLMEGAALTPLTYTLVRDLQTEAITT